MKLVILLICKSDTLDINYNTYGLLLVMQAKPSAS